MEPAGTVFWPGSFLISSTYYLCTVNVPVVNCEGNFSYGNCSVTCGTGVKTGTFVVACPASGGGSACSNLPGDTTTATCTLPPCGIVQSCSWGFPAAMPFVCVCQLSVSLSHAFLPTAGSFLYLRLLPWFPSLHFALINSASSELRGELHVRQLLRDLWQWGADGGLPRHRARLGGRPSLRQPPGRHRDHQLHAPSLRCVCVFFLVFRASWISARGIHVRTEAGRLHRRDRVVLFVWARRPPSSSALRLCAVV